MDMNLEYIFDELRTRAEAALTLLNGKGGALGQTELVTVAVAALIGVLFCFLGMKMVRFWAALFGLAIGAGGGAYCSAYFGLSGYVPLIIGGVVGLLLAVLCARFYLAGAFLVEWTLASLVSAWFLRPDRWELALVCAGIGLVIALITLKLTAPVTMLVTGIAGGLLAGQAAYVLLPVKGLVLRIALAAVLAVLGVIVQFLLESKRRKKLHLKKAEEIRKTHSVANEVDRARAMMEELDGGEPVKKERSAKEERPAKAGKALKERSRVKAGRADTAEKTKAGKADVAVKVRAGKADAAAKTRAGKADAAAKKGSGKADTAAKIRTAEADTASRAEDSDEIE